MVVQVGARCRIRNANRMVWFCHYSNKNEAHKAILGKLGVDRMPTNTLVTTQADILAGKAPQSYAARLRRSQALSSSKSLVMSA